MAADAKLLLDSLLHADSSSFHLLLECLEHSQVLQEKSVAREWITKVNSLLSSNQDRWMGLCLLDCLLRQCDSELFVENCSLWLKTLARMLQQMKLNLNLCEYIADILERIFGFSIQFPELSREISSSVIPSLLTVILNEKDVNWEVSLQVIKSCVQYYPGPTGSFWKRIESLLLQTFNNSDFSLNKAACSCFALLPNCSNSTGTSGDKQSASWEMQWRKILSTISTILDCLYNNCETESLFKVNSTALDMNAIPVIEPQRTETCVFRIKCMLLCLDSMLRNGFSKSVNIPVESTMKLLQRLLAVNGKSITNHVAIESVLLKCSLPAIHISAINFLSTFIESCNVSLLIYHQNITKIFLLELSWSTTDKKNSGFQQTFSGLRSAVYECLNLWIHITGSVGEQTDSIKKLIRHLIEDIKPQVATTKLLAPTTSKNVQQGKKTKRRRMQDDVGQLMMTRQKIDHFANAELCISGLKALKLIISKASNEIPPESLKEIQMFVVTLLLECQVSIFSSSPHSSYPIPYGSTQCRKLLYQLLQCLLYHHNPSSPPPVQHAVRIFSQGIQDRNLEVSMFCAEAQMLCHVLIHPRVPVLASSLCLAQQQQQHIASQRYNKLPEVNNVNSSHESVEMELSSADSGLASTSKSTEEANDYNGELHIASSRNSEKERECAQNDLASGSLIREDYSLITHNQDVRDPVGELLPGFGSERADSTTAVFSIVNTMQVNINEKTNVKSCNNISKNPNQDTTTNSPESSDKNVTDARNSLRSGRETSTDADKNCPPLKKRKTSDINCNSMEDDGKYEMDTHTDKQTSNEIKESDEDEELAKTMIASFVDSVPDSD